MYHSNDSKNRVNLLTSFINPSFLHRIKNKAGFSKGLDHEEILQSVEQIGLQEDAAHSSDIDSVVGTQCEITHAIKKAQQYLFEIQQPDGHWIAELEDNMTLTSEYIMLMYFMDMVDPVKMQKAANYILSKQLNDGSWPVFYGGEGDISTTVESYFALKLAGYDVDHPNLKKAREFILASGGIMKSRVITKISLAFFGQFDWRGTPSLPVEMLYIPRFSSFNIYEFSSWARICVVPLTVLMELKPLVEIPASATLDELYLVPRDQQNFSFEKHENVISWHNFFVGMDKILKLLEKSPIKISKKLALRKAEKWILEHQDKSGDWGGIFPAMAYSIMALRTLGYDNDFPAIKKGFEAIERFHIETDEYIHQQSCVSPVWDTGWSMLALHESGVAGNHPDLVKAATWLYDKQTTRPGDWKVKNPEAQPGGWSFEYFNEFYPDADDTGLIILILKDIQAPAGIDKSQRLRKALQWLLSMQNTDGGWGAFDKDVNNPIYNKILFNDFKTMLDPSCPDITGRVIELLAKLGYKKSFEPIQHAIAYLEKDQLSEGPWFGRWGVNYLYGTWAVLSGLAAIGEDRNKAYVARAIDWLFAHQNDDGGWGEHCHSYKSPDYIGRGVSTPSQTSWALLSLIDYGFAHDEHVRKGIDFLLHNQLTDGTWEEEEFTGTGFPNAFYIRYHLYRHYFPLLTLAHYKKNIQ